MLKSHRPSLTHACTTDCLFVGDNTWVWWDPFLLGADPILRDTVGVVRRPTQLEIRTGVLMALSDRARLLVASHQELWEQIFRLQTQKGSALEECGVRGQSQGQVDTSNPSGYSNWPRHSGTYSRNCTLAHSTEAEVPRLSNGYSECVLLPGNCAFIRLAALVATSSSSGVKRKTPLTIYHMPVYYGMYLILPCSH